MRLVPKTSFKVTIQHSIYCDSINSTCTPIRKGRWNILLCTMRSRTTAADRSFRYLHKAVPYSKSATEVSIYCRRQSRLLVRHENVPPSKTLHIMGILQFSSIKPLNNPTHPTITASISVNAFRTNSSSKWMLTVYPRPPNHHHRYRPTIPSNISRHPHDLSATPQYLYRFLPTRAHFLVCSREIEETTTPGQHDKIQPKTERYH